MQSKSSLQEFIERLKRVDLDTLVIPINLSTTAFFDSCPGGSRTSPGGRIHPSLLIRVHLA